jgi:hypothetical protein
METRFGFRVRTQPPAVPSRVPVVARAVTFPALKPRTEENNCGISSLTRTMIQ